MIKIVIYRKDRYLKVLSASLAATKVRDYEFSWALAFFVIRSAQNSSLCFPAQYLHNLAVRRAVATPEGSLPLRRVGRGVRLPADKSIGSSVTTSIVDA